MSKRARHQPGFYASLFDDRGLSHKYWPKQKPVVIGIYEVERIVSKRNQGRNVEYFIQWKNHSSTENTWEPPEHLPEDLIAAFERRSVDPVRIDECRERLALWEGSESNPGVQRDHCHAARCDASAWGTQDWPGILWALISAHGQHAVFLERNRLLKSKFSWSEFFAV